MDDIRGTLLVIDDAQDNRTLLFEILSDSYKVILAKDGVQGIELTKKHLPDVILLDVIMPGMDGYQVIKLLKQSEETMHIPVIFISSMSTTDDEERGLQLGAVDYITKPFHPAIVKARIKNHLRECYQKKLLSELALVDGLTGIYNRRFCDKEMDKTWNICRRNKSCLSVAMIDIDYFKSYNDHYGHALGDEVLRRTAKSINNHLKRPNDVVARYGGEEFIVILPNTQAREAKRILNEICHLIENNTIKHELSSVSHYLTISAGGASMIPEQDITIESFLKKVDVNLYQAKAQGRNRVCWQQDDNP